MNTTLISRANGACEICTTTSDNLLSYLLAPKTDDTAQVALCNICHDAITNNNFDNANHFRALTGSIWSEHSAVKVLSYQLLQKLNTHDWASEALDAAYLDEDELLWANAEAEALANAVIHKDAYGVVLNSGDTILLTENLNVKGTNFIAPKGTKVSKIRLVADNAEQIEGKIEGSTIVILTKFVRKSV